GWWAMDASGSVDPGLAMASGWRGALPPESGFTHLEDVPARVMLDLAQRGAQLAKEHSSSHGPPVSLLDQEVIRVSSADVSVGVPMRCVFALTAMGFLPQSADEIGADEIVRVRTQPSWLRVDAKFGSVYRRSGAGGSGAGRTRRWCCAECAGALRPARPPRRGATCRPPGARWPGSLLPAAKRSGGGRRSARTPGPRRAAGRSAHRASRR